MEEKMKKYLTKSDFEQFEPDDTRYYGVFVSGKKGNLKVKIDPKRYQKTTDNKLSEEQLKIINNRQTHYFVPLKEEYYSYYCNQFENTIKDIRDYWQKYYNPLICYAKNKIKKPKEVCSGDCHLAACGILDSVEAEMWARRENSVNEYEYLLENVMVVGGLYAQFVHYMASAIESITVSVLTKEKAMEDHFDRNSLYGTAVKTGKSVKELPSFEWYDKLYSLWNFLKHNSQSTYDKIKTSYPQALAKGHENFRQGDFATWIIVFSDEMIATILNGVSAFFKEYCELVFGEKYDEAQWNYSRYFLDEVCDKIDLYINPLGLPSFI